MTTWANVRKTIEGGGAQLGEPIGLLLVLTRALPAYAFQTWTPGTKNTAAFTPGTKNAATWTPQSKS